MKRWLLLSLLFGCTSSKAPPPPIDALEVSMTIEGGHFRVAGQEPDLLVLPPGQDVRLTIHSSEGTPTVSIPDMDLRMTAIPRAAPAEFRTWACPREACVYEVLAWPKLGATPIRGSLRVVPPENAL